MLAMVVAAISGTEGGAAGSITAAWDDLTIAVPLGGQEETSSSVVFTGGGSRTLLFEHDITIGSLAVKVDAGGYATATSGYTKEVTTGQVVYIRYTCFGSSETATLTVTDDTLSALIDTILLEHTV